MRIANANQAYILNPIVIALKSGKYMDKRHYVKQSEAGNGNEGLNTQL